MMKFFRWFDSLQYSVIGYYLKGIHCFKKLTLKALQLKTGNQITKGFSATLVK